jgi:hypothetical protein
MALLALITGVEVTSIIVLGVSGDFLNTSVPVMIPKYYEDMYQYLKSQLDIEYFRVAIAGYKNIYRISWIPNNFWENHIFIYFGLPTVGEFILHPKPQLANIVFYLLDLTHADLLYTNFSSISLQRLLGLMSVKYVAVQYDIEGINQSLAYSPHTMESKLGVKPVRFDLVHLYENPLFLPIVYVPQYLIFVGNDSVEWITAAGDSRLPYIAPVAFTNNHSLFSYFKSLPNVNMLTSNILEMPKATIINYTINRTTYASFIASLQASDEPILIVFNMPFDPRFEISVIGGKVIDHVTVNSYSNAWIIQPINQKLEISVRYNAHVLIKLSPIFLPIFLAATTITWIITENHKKRLYLK